MSWFHFVMVCFSLVFLIIFGISDGFMGFRDLLLFCNNLVIIIPLLISGLFQIPPSSLQRDPGEIICSLEFKKRRNVIRNTKEQVRGLEFSECSPFTPPPPIESFSSRLFSKPISFWKFFSPRRVWCYLLCPVTGPSSYFLLRIT